MPVSDDETKGNATTDHPVLPTSNCDDSGHLALTDQKDASLLAPMVSVTHTKKASSNQLIVQCKVKNNALESLATAGGVVSYQEKIMYLTVAHVFNPSNRVREDLSKVSSTDPHEEGDEIEMTGLSDFGDEEEEDNLGVADITCQGMLRPQLGDVKFQQEHHASTTSVNQTDQTWITGKVVILSQALDYALVEVTPATEAEELDTSWNKSVPLEKYGAYVELAPQNRGEMAIITTTSGGGTIRGVLHETIALMTFTGLNEFVEVYTAQFEQPLVPSDAGAWVYDATGSGKIIGHIAISGSQMFTCIVPAHHVFRHALETIARMGKENSLLPS